MNLIDYVIEEEKEIGGNKGEDSLSTSRSTTYSKYLLTKDLIEDSEKMIVTFSSVVYSVMTTKMRKRPPRVEFQLIKNRRLQRKKKDS